MRLTASKKIFQLSAALALTIALLPCLKPALGYTYLSDSMFATGGSSEGGGVWSTGSATEGSGAFGTGSTENPQGALTTGYKEGGNAFSSGATSESGGAFNSGASSDSGLGLANVYVPPNPHAWSTYSGPKAPAPWGAATLSASGGIVNAGSEAEANAGPKISADSVDYSDIKADTASHVHYYGK